MFGSKLKQSNSDEGDYLAFSLDVPVDGQMVGLRRQGRGGRVKRGVNERIWRSREMGSSRWAEAAPDYHHPPLRMTTWASVQDEPCTPERHRTSTPITSLTDATWTSPRDMDHDDGANGSILNADVQGRWVLGPRKKARSIQRRCGIWRNPDADLGIIPWTDPAGVSRWLRGQK